MFRAITKMAWADLRAKRLQTSLLFLVVMAATALASGTFAVERAASNSYERALDQANGAHIWFSSFSESDARSAAEMPGVLESTDVYEQVRGALIGGGEPDDVVFVGIGAQPQIVNTAIVLDGTWITRDNGDEIVITRDLARKSGLGLGDSATALSANAGKDLTVVGIALDTSFFPYPSTRPGMVWVSPATARDLAGGSLTGLATEELRRRRADFLIGVRINNPSEVNQFASNAIDLQDGLYGRRTWQEIRDRVVEVNDGPAVILRIFAIFGTMSAGVIVASAITSHVLAQMREVGVLKASGFGPRHITLTFLLEQLALSLPAAIVGSVIGILTAPTILDRFGTSLHFKPPPEFDPSVMSMVVGTVLLLILAFTFFPSWRAGRISTVAAISNLHRAGGNTASRMASVAIRLHLPRVTAMGAKDLFAHRTRAWLTVVAVAVAVVTALFVSMLFGTLSRFDSDPVSYGAWPYELQVYVLPEFGTGDASSGFLAAGTANPIPREEVMAVANSFNEIVGIVESREVWTRPQGFESSIPTYILDGNAQDLGFRLVEGRLFASTGEAIMGLGLAQTTGKRLGDEVTTYVPLDPHKTGEDDEWQAVLLEIVGTYISTANVGRNLVYSGDSIAGMDIVPSPGLISLKLAPDADRDLLAARFTAATDGRVIIRDLVADFDRGNEDERELIPLMLLLSGLLILLAGISLWIAMMFAVAERTREFGIMKVVGFSPGQIVQSVITGATLLALVGIVIGIPLGYYLTTEVFMRLASTEGAPDDLFQLPSALWLLGIVAATVGMAIVGALLPAWHAAGIRVADAFRFE